MPIERKCLTCGRTFSIKPSVLKRRRGAGKYCSRKCRTLRVKKTCSYCGRIIWACPCHIKNGEKKYCSLTCRGRARSINLRGPKNPLWRGGKRSMGNKYIGCYVPTARTFGPSKYVLEHRLIAEEMLGRPLRSEEVVHHINGNPEDNRRENLLVFPSQGKHMEHHAKTRHLAPSTMKQQDLGL